MKINLNQRRLLLAIVFLWGIGISFLPIRNDVVTGYYKGETPDTRVLVPAHETHTSSILIGFNGHPGGIAGLMLFALFPFLIVWESFSIRRPFSLPARAFLQLQALMLFLGGPYCFYMATFEEGNFSDAVHTTQMGWGGWILFAQDILLAAFVFTIVANQKGKFAELFEERE